MNITEKTSRNLQLLLKHDRQNRDLYGSDIMFAIMNREDVNELIDDMIEDFIIDISYEMSDDPAGLEAIKKEFE
jgi:hypothetical protein